MSIYDWLDNEFNSTIVSDIAFSQLVATAPCIIPSTEYMKIQERLRIIHEFQDGCIRLFKNALRDNDEVLLKWLVNETPVSLGIEYHKALLDWHFTKPVFFRTDEMELGKIAEIQCPGSHWGELESLYSYYRDVNSLHAQNTPSILFTRQLRKYLGDYQPVVCYLTDNSSAPIGVRYFINKTRPGIKYWGIDNGVKALDCNFIRSHSFYGLCADNFFKFRQKQSRPQFKYDFPPNVLFDQKATLVLPFWSRTRNFFTDEVRNHIIYSTPLISDNIELDNGECITTNEFSSKPQSQRAYYLKYAGSDVSINWGSRAIYRLSNESSGHCKELLQRCLDDSKRGRIWILQKEVTSKDEVNYLDRTGDERIEKLNVKYSVFYGPFGVIGVMKYHRKHFKVHGQYDNVLSLVIPETD